MLPAQKPEEVAVVVGPDLHVLRQGGVRADDDEYRRRNLHGLGALYCSGDQGLNFRFVVTQEAPDSVLALITRRGCCPHPQRVHPQFLPQPSDQGPELEMVV